MKFLTTGVLETITREDAVELLRQCGGHVMSGMSKNLNYLIVGRDAGQLLLFFLFLFFSSIFASHVSSLISRLSFLVSLGPRKLEDAEEWGITQLSEEEFFNFIKERIESYDPSHDNGVEEKPKKKAVKKEVGKKHEPKEEPKSPKKKEPKKKATSVREEVGGKRKVADIKPKASRGRAAIEIDMTEEDVGTKSIKSESGRAKKRTKAGESSTSKQTAVKDEPVSDVEEPSMVETKVVTKKKSAKKELIVKTELPDEEAVKPKRGRSKK